MVVWCWFIVGEVGLLLIFEMFRLYLVVFVVFLLNSVFIFWVLMVFFWKVKVDFIITDFGLVIGKWVV